METIGIEQFYEKSAIEFIHDLGNFSVTTVDDLSTCVMQPIPYTRKNFYKINLMQGRYKIHYSDKTYTVQKRAILFASPRIPYSWLPQDGKHSGVYCIFAPEFFHQFGDLDNYEVFGYEGDHVIELSNEQYDQLALIFAKMQNEFEGDYHHKLDLLRNLVFEVLHSATKISAHNTHKKIHDQSSKRLTDAFSALLEGQFPITATNQRVRLLKPVDFAEKLAVHVNHLNRTLKKTMGLSTSKLIQDRVLREAKVLLKHSTLNISEIADLLGFKEATHFSNFFKKQEEMSPSQYRMI